MNSIPRHRHGNRAGHSKKFNPLGNGSDYDNLDLARDAASCDTCLAAPPREWAIAGEDLSPVKARILLMVALTKTERGADIQRMFIQY